VAGSFSFSLEELMKKPFLFLLAAVLLGCGCGFGCGGSDKDRAKNSQADRPMPTGAAKE
jgi:hypothetical protein